MLLLFLAICVFQSVLAYYQFFSPYEKERNLLAIVWGARPGPRFWAVAALDVLTAALQVLLIVLIAAPPGSLPTLTSALYPAWLAWLVVVPLLAVFYHLLNDTLIRFPRYGLMARRGALLLAYGVPLVGVLLGFSAIAGQRGLNLAGWQQLFLPAYGLAALVFGLQALAFYLRTLPLAGRFLHVSVSSGLTVWLLTRYAAWQVCAPLACDVVWPPYDALTPTLVLLGLATLAALAAWRLPGARPHPQAVQPPALVSQPPSAVETRCILAGSEASLVCGAFTVQVNTAPLAIHIANQTGETLWQLAPGGLSRDLLLFRLTALPFLYTGNTIKVRWPLTRRSLDHAIAIETDERSLTLHLPGASLRIQAHNEQVLRLSLERRPGPVPAWDALSLAFTSPPDAHYLGFGQRFNRFDQRGEEIYFVVEEGGVGYAGLAPLLKHLYGARGSFPNGEQCTSFPVPFGLVSRQDGPTSGLFWDSYQPAWLDLRRAGYARLTVLGEQLDLYLCAGPTALDAIDQFTALTGRPLTPPPWVLLPWKTRTGAVTEEDAREDIHRFRQLNIPLAHVGIEHWQEVRGSYEFSQQWYPHIQEVIAEAQQRGYHITIWHFPYMNAGCDTHRQGLRRGYFLRNRLGLPYYQRIFHGHATVIDYTNPEAAAWHEEIVAERLYRLGFRGAMTDYGESIPADCVFANGQEGLNMRNAYPVLYCQSMQRAARQVWGEDHLIYPRAGYAASQRYITVQWPGDQDTDWDEGDGLPAAVRAMLNVSLCGFPVHGSDIGGWYDWFTPITSKELFIRWAEVGAYSPLMRAHGGPTGRNREPWKFDDETVAVYRRLSEEHVRIFPYLYSLAVEASRNGAPLIRHPALLWPDRAELYGVEDAWMIGDALYVAPVVRPGQDSRTVLLPPGRWWDLNANRPLEGPARLVVPAPYGCVPRFLRQGYPLPCFARSFETFADVPGVQRGSLDDPLRVLLYPGPGEVHFTLFDGRRLCAGPNRATAAGGASPVEWVLLQEGEPSSRL